MPRATGAPKPGTGSGCVHCARRAATDADRAAAFRFLIAIGKEDPTVWMKLVLRFVALLPLLPLSWFHQQDYEPHIPQRAILFFRGW